MQEKFSSEPGIVHRAMCTTDRDKEFGDRLLPSLAQNSARLNSLLMSLQMMMKLGRTVFIGNYVEQRGYSASMNILRCTYEESSRVCYCREG